MGGSSYQGLSPNIRGQHARKFRTEAKLVGKHRRTCRAPRERVAEVMHQTSTAVSIFEALPEQEKRKWEAERRIVRDGIRKAKHLPRRDRECLMYLTNLWFYHRNDEGFIHPGATKVAGKLECSVRTVKATFKRLRDAGYLVPLEYSKGGRRATWYAVDIGKILDDLCHRPRGFSLDWDEAKGRSSAQINRAKLAANRAKVAHGIHREGKEKPLPEVFDDPSDWQEVPF